MNATPAAVHTRRVTSPRTVLLVASLGGFLAFLDATIVNVAIPSIREDFPESGLDGVSWVLNAYNIVFAAFLVASGRLADLLGRKRVFETGIVIFTVASVLCAIAPSLLFLIIARVLQALGAAIIVPASLALVMNAFSGREQARGVALWSAGAALAAGVGPAAGGALIEIADWRWCFLVNLPIGILAWRQSGKQLVESRSPGKRTVPDVLGALVLALAIALLTTGIVKGGDWGYASLEVLGSWAAAAALTALFIQRCRVHRSPIVDLGLMRIRSFSVANVLTIAGGMGYFGYILCNVLFLTVVWKYSALEAGLALTPGPFVAVAIAAPLGRLTTKVDPRLIVIPGGLIWTAGVVYMITAVGSQPAFLSEWLLGMVILGVGAGATFPTLSGAAAAAAPGNAYATATALNSVARQLGAVLGVAMLVAVIGTPDPTEVLDAFDRGWTFAAACLLVAALGALFLGRIRFEDERVEEAGALQSDELGDAAAALRTDTLSVPHPASPALGATAAAAPGREEPVTAFLARVKIFQGLDEARFEEVAAGAHDRYLAGGETLFEAGDEGDSLYVVRTGRLEVIIGGEVIGVMGSGEVVGELALLADSTRAATIVARRDSLLLEVPRDHLLRLIEDAPGFARALVKVLGTQLQKSRGFVDAAPALPNILCVAAPIEGTPVMEFARGLAASLAAHGSIAVLRDEHGSSEDFAAVVERVERDHERVLLIGEHHWRDSEWTRFCVRHADRVLAVIDAPMPDGWDGPPGFTGADAVFTCPAGVDVTGWLDRLSPRTTHRVLPGSDGSVDVVARRLTGTSVGVVLSGGGARGLSHIGALEEILAAGIKVDRIAGCSFGSFIGGLYAQGMGIDEIDARCHEEWVRRRPLNDYTMPRTSLIRGLKIRQMLARNFVGPIELTERHFFCVTTDVLTAELVVHRRGSLVHAIGGSMNLPGLAPPLAAGGRLLVDGGLRNNLPIDIMAESGEGPMIAVDVGGATAQELVRDVDLTGARPRGFPEYYGAEEEDLDVLLPGIGELMTRIVTLSSADGAALAEKYAALVIRPTSDGVGLFEFHQLDTLRESGRRAARLALRGDVPDALGEPAPAAVEA